MAAVGHSITPEAFALAISDLPLENIYTKAAELQNSITHLLNSNIQMQPFAEEGDFVCRDAIRENNEVIKRMEERIGLCRTEVESRGQVWMGGTSIRAEANEGELLPNGELLSNGVNGHAQESSVEHSRQPSGRLNDEELRRQLEAQLGDDDDEGVHL
jgi:hypothetical protein